ncbi:homoserine O-succinyltransferase [Bacillus sp. CGMCC 1.16607]|uniref:homoserine O-acetyltransferase MetA n=1 Tax=Bacillus sp. CGMCC 1.16607 TaxID=3351842 RepID=UPI0036416C3C
MPINIPKKLPAGEVLRLENIFIMDEDRATTQDIRPLNILILNLMPEKEKTEVQLLRLLGNTPLQVNITLLKTKSYHSKNTSQSHLEQFYSTFEEVRSKRFDGLIITGAPIEHLPFENVDYWQELSEVMEWSKENVTSSLHICWGAQAALYYHFGIDKHELGKKCSGVFEHLVSDWSEPILRGFDDVFPAPVSRYTDVSMEKIRQASDLKLLSYSEEAGPLLISSTDGKMLMITGHLEYENETLAQEYERDIAKNLDIDVPKNYFPNNDPTEKPINRWRSHGHLLFSNWLNYYVYQETPFEWK